MKPIYRAFPFAFLALAATGCGSEPPAEQASLENEQEVAAAGNVAENAAALPPAAMPPMIAESRAYRCDDGDALYVNVLTDENQVSVRDRRADAPTALTREAEGQDFTGPGRSLSGVGDTVRYSAPERPEQQCRVAG